METERRNYLRESALEKLGPGDYDRLVVSVASAKGLGRLRYWQEQLLARLPGSPIAFDEFIAAFDGAPMQRPPSESSTPVAKVESPQEWIKNAPVWVQEGRQLNEAEWLADPHLIWIVSFLLHTRLDHPGEDRRHLLFGCACCRMVWDLLQLDAARR